MSPFAEEVVWVGEEFGRFGDEALRQAACLLELLKAVTRATHKCFCLVLVRRQVTIRDCFASSEDVNIIVAVVEQSGVVRGALIDDGIASVVSCQDLVKIPVEKQGKSVF